MTNDELNAWYHEKVLGKCAHYWVRKLEGPETDVYSAAYSTCAKCRTVFDGQIYWKEVSNYLADPAVVLKETIALMKEGYSFKYYRGDKEFLIGTNALDADFPRAVFLALKKKMEVDGA